MMRINIHIKEIKYLLATAIVLLSFSTSRCLADIGDPWETWEDDYIDGTLTYGDGFVANDGWIPTEGEVTQLYWKVTAVYDEDGFIDHFNYSYTFTVPKKSLSHFILQVSDNPDLKFNEVDGFPELDYVNATLPDEMIALLDLYTPSVDEDGNPVKPNPDMPGDIYGLKFEGFGEENVATWSFDSWREPVWGNFFAVDGTNQDGIWATAWNSGFLDDPYTWNELEGMWNWQIYGYIATPDTSLVPLPGAVILGVLGLGVVGIKLRKFA